MAKGLIISFDGHDGTGKSTIINAVNEFLISRGMNTIIISNLELGADDLFLKSQIDNAELNDELFCKYYFMLSFRKHLLSEVYSMSYDVVIVDRYFYSSLAFCDVKGVQISDSGLRMIPAPSLGYWVTVDEQTRRERLFARPSKLSESDIASTNDPDMILKANKTYSKFGLIRLDSLEGTKRNVLKVYQDIYNISSMQ